VYLLGIEELLKKLMFSANPRLAGLEEGKETGYTTVYK
jgi:hypothetical protein